MMTTYQMGCRAILAVLGSAAIVYVLFIKTTGNDPNGDLYNENTPKALHRTTASAPLGEDRLETPAKPADPAPDRPTLPPEIDTIGKSRFDQLPEELRNQLFHVYREMSYGNFDHAAHIARDALVLADEYPEWRIELYYYQGSCYDRLGYTYMAIEQYKLALALQPLHRSSYTAMRAISPEFASANEELPPIKITLPKTGTSEKQQD